MPASPLSEQELRAAEVQYGLRPPPPCPICRAERTVLVTYKDGTKTYICPNAKGGQLQHEREHRVMGTFGTRSSELIERLLVEVRARRG